MGQFATGFLSFAAQNLRPLNDFLIFAVPLGWSQKNSEVDKWPRAGL